MHELATNAVKHGAWSSTGGRVKVSWQFVTNGASGNNLRVTWLELDGPVVVSPTRKGFGHVVIESMAAQSREKFVGEMMSIELSIRGMLKVHGIKIGAVHRCAFAKKVDDLLEGNADPREAIGPLLEARNLMRRQKVLLDRKVAQMARKQPTCSAVSQTSAP